MSNTLDLILEPEAFAKLSPEDNWLIVDLSNEGSYRQGHIAGAVFVPPGVLMCGIPPAPGKIPSLEHLNNLFSQLGLTEDTHVIVYDDEGGGWAGRLIWTLDAVGHHRYSYINGGITAWRAAGLPLETTINQATPSSTNLSIVESTVIEAEDIISQLDSIQVWDARSPEEYNGTKILAQRGGHMPGAINAEWTSLMDSTKGLRIRDDAKEHLASLGIDGLKPIVTHCQSHHRSGFTYLVGKALGYDIKGYHGSWSEWGNRSDTPIDA